MLNPYVIIDNFFEDPVKIQTTAKDMEYWLKYCTIKNLKVNKKEDVYGIKNTDWRGARTDPLHTIKNNLHNDIICLIFKKLFNSLNNFYFEYKAVSFFHFTPETITLENVNKWHRDSADLIAGVVYLNETPKEDSGTLLKCDGNTIINVENKFNRLLVYQSNILHAPSSFFGSSVDDARLTFTFFVKKFTLNASN